MNAPVSVAVPHRLGKDEAVRRLKSGLSRMASNLGALITIEKEVWSGDTLSFQMRGLGQSASGTIEVLQDSVRIDVMLPWLLASLAQRLAPALRKEATLLLESK